MESPESSRRDVRETYERIGRHFAETRPRPWPAVERFVENAEDVALALDLGCGNARHAEVLAARADRVLGIDASHAVLETARERREGRFAVELCQAEATALPVAPRTFGLAVYIATIHHLPTRELRIESLDELARVLTPDGRALVSAWSATHDRFSRKKGFDTTVDWTLPDGETVPRFYHIYDPGEFEADIERSALVCERSFTERGNCYAVVGDGGEGKRT